MRRNARAGQVGIVSRPVVAARPGLRKASEENSNSGLQNLNLAALKGGHVGFKAAMNMKSGVAESVGLNKRAVLNAGCENEPVSKLAKLIGKKPDASTSCGVKMVEVAKAVEAQQLSKGLRAVSKNVQLSKSVVSSRLNPPAKQSEAACLKLDVVTSQSSSSTSQEVAEKPPVQIPAEEQAALPQVRVTRSLSRKLNRDSDGNEAISNSRLSQTASDVVASQISSGVSVSACDSVTSAQVAEKIENEAHRCAQCHAPVTNQSDSGLELGSDASCAGSTIAVSSSRQPLVARDPLSLTDFVDEIFAYYQLRELRYVPDDYLRLGIARSRFSVPASPQGNEASVSKLASLNGTGRALQSNLTPFMRAVLIDWLVEIQLTFELTHEPLYIAVRLVDTYLSRSRSNLPVSKLQLLGLICMLLGTKYEERQPPAFVDLLELCDNAYNEEDLINMELDVLRTVGYDLGAPLSYRFLRRYANVINESLETLTLARYVLEVTLMLYEFVVELDSEMAAAALLLALLIKRVQRSQSVTDASNAQQSTEEAALWPVTLAEASGYHESDLYPLVRKLNQAVPMKVYPKLQTVRGKYAQEPFFCVAKNYRQLTDDELAVFEKSAHERDDQERRRREAEAEERQKKESVAHSAKLCSRCAAGVKTGPQRRSATRNSK